MFAAMVGLADEIPHDGRTDESGAAGDQEPLGHQEPSSRNGVTKSAKQVCDPYRKESRPQQKLAT
jgi:hypothetical protein